MYARLFGRDGTATIAVINKSSVVTNHEVTAAVAALQVQVTRDFAPAWGRPASLRVISDKADLRPEDWLLLILDNSDEAGALGYHDWAKRPVTKVFAKTDKKYGLNWTVTASHEVVEMLGDPTIDLLVPYRGVLYSYETADPVEDDDMGYVIDGIHVSNFVTPAWFVDGSDGPWDFRGVTKSAFEIAEGGYASVFDPHTKRWRDLHPGEMGRRLKSKREKTGGRTQIRKARPIR